MASPLPPSTAGAAGSPPPPAQVVGNAFVHQYYNVLHQSPELVYRFYQDASRLGRPAKSGAEMDVVTTMEAINQKIMSMDVVRAEIRAVDAQESLGGGVTVLVMGHLTRRTGVSLEFVQFFFLAPQEKGYFVLNDILRYVGEGKGEEDIAVQPPTPEVAVPVLPNGTMAGATKTLSREQDVSPQPEPHVAEPATHPQDEDMNEADVYNLLNDTQEPVVEEILVPEVINEVLNRAPVAAPTSIPPVPAEEAPKKSYASIVKVMKEHRPPVSPAPARTAAPKPEKQAPSAPAPVADVPAVSSNHQSGSYQDPEVDTHAIYVRNLPLNATTQQLEDEFKTFGTIKTDGIQVRSNKIQGFCFGFVEFEDASSVQSAIEASPVMIGDRQCYVEGKRTNGSRGSSRGGRFATGRGGNFRGEGVRGRGNYSGGRSHGRGEFNYRSDYGGSGGASRGGGDVGYQRVDHSSSNGGRGARAPSATTAAAK